MSWATWPNASFALTHCVMGVKGGIISPVMEVYEAILHDTVDNFNETISFVSPRRVTMDKHNCKLRYNNTVVVGDRQQIILKELYLSILGPWTPRRPLLL